MIEQIQGLPLPGPQIHPLPAPKKKIKKISNDQELIQSDPTSCPQNQ